IDARGPLPPADAVNYSLQIAHALRHIANAGVVHRDDKPSNIIITPTGRAKLLNLGLARKIDSDASRDLTVDGTTLGTFDYISPEQAKDPRNVDIRSDVYSLGCTLYHMLTGEPPYPRGTMLQKLLDHQHKDVPDVSARNSSVPPELSAVVRKMMASDPAERYQLADELIGDLAILAHAYGLRPIASEAHIWAPPSRLSGWALLRRHQAWIATAALLIVGVLTIDFVQSMMARRQTDPSPGTGEVASKPSLTASDETQQRVTAAASPQTDLEAPVPTADWPVADIRPLEVSDSEPTGSGLEIADLPAEAPPAAPRPSGPLTAALTA